MFKWIRALFRKWFPLEEGQVNDIVIDFLSEWLDWAITRPALDTVCFEKQHGLCHCLCLWSLNKGYECDDVKQLEYHLKNMFEEDGLNIAYPFGYDNYVHCAENNAMHMSEKRRNWVISRIERSIHDY